MSRPFFYESIATLESHFEERKTDIEFLKLLAEELSFRSTARAKNLSAQVYKLLEASGNNKQTHQSNPSSSSSGSIPKVTVEDYKKQNNKTASNIPITNKAPDILSSWIALEVLSPQTFRRQQELAGTFGSIASLDNKSLPWEGEGESSKPNYRLYYQVVLGTIDFEKSISALLDIYSDKREERPVVKGEAILAVIVLDKKGRPVEAPAAAISSFGWGVPQALKGDLQILGNWSKVENKITTELDTIIRQTDEEGNIFPVTRAILDFAREHLINTLGLPEELVTKNRFAIRTYEYFKNSEAPAPLLLNSFFIGDLIKAAGLFEKNVATNNLQRYLGVKQPDFRKDLLHDGQALEFSVSPSLIPFGRWPSPGRHPLVLLQQAAVNLSLNDLKLEGILAVNGPPGTGKSTLLRDIVAGLITKRAEAMLAFDDPAAAFNDSGKRISVGQATLRLYEVNSALKGFEMLIASSNNKAVENVSAELPALKAIARDAEELRYFSSLSDALLDRQTWGLVAAVLGNAANRNQFKQSFWWDKEIGFATYLAEAAGTPQFIDVVDEKTNQVIGNRKPRIITEENAPGSREEALLRWKAAKDNFKRALETAKEELSKLEQTRQVVLSLSQLAKKESDAKNYLQHTQTNNDIAKNNFENANKNLGITEETLAAAHKTLSEHLKLRPGFFARLFGTSKAIFWKQKQKEYSTAHKETEKDHRDKSLLVEKAKSILANSEAALNTAEGSVKTASINYRNAKKQVDDAKQILADHFINEDFFLKSHQDRHKISPWCDNSTQRLRDDVFIAAIHLHKAFIDASAKELKHNLGLLMTVFSGRTFEEIEKNNLLADLWSSLFLVVPSVSTTFASVERMLGNIPQKSIGWLLIDEAGQALPQAAVGALMRTKRAIVVGDPLQIEPVVVLPDSLTQNILKRFGVEPRLFNAPEASAQTLSDNATHYFGEFDGKYGSRLVGVPLLVHRRCSEPMFSISNAVAYERLMVQAKKPTDSQIKNCLGDSRWIDVQGKGQEKWCPKEGEEVLALLRRLKIANVIPDIYIVTPFVIVAESL
ncbi:MAG TPA: AAA domain-containing protein, partial [Chitinophagaceae bacterium]|nr:AAA domain-containing protein [Chitinophagaceae bacterium]